VSSNEIVQSQARQISPFFHTAPHPVHLEPFGPPANDAARVLYQPSPPWACYLAAMKSNDSQISITAPLLKELMDREKANSKINNADPSVGSKPLPPPDLYQDSGGGYNEDFTFPQE
jgi:hypothetical protein